MADVTKKVTEEIKKIIANIAECEPKEVGLDADFYKDLGVDSIKAIELVVAVEKKFSITIRDKNIAKITTVSQILKLVESLLAKRSKK